MQTRRVYSLFDFGADIGGLQGALVPVFTLIVSVFGPASYYRSLITGLFAIDYASTV